MTQRTMLKERKLSLSRNHKVHAAGSSPHASAASMPSDSAHGCTQPQGDGADHEEKIDDDDSFDQKSHHSSVSKFIAFVAHTYLYSLV